MTVIQQQQRFGIDTKLLPVKLTYFFTFAGVASLLPYIGVFMRNVGLSASESAIISGTLTFVGAMATGVVGAMADKLHQHRSIIITCSILTAMLHGCLTLIPNNARTELTSNITAVTLSCQTSGSFFTKCPVPVNIDDGVDGSIVNDDSTCNTDLHFLSSSCWLACTMPVFTYNSSEFWVHATDAGLPNSTQAIRLLNDGSNKTDIHFDVLTLSCNRNSASAHDQYVMASYQLGGMRFSNISCTNRVNLPCTINCPNFLKSSQRHDRGQGSSRARFGKLFFMFAAIFGLSQVTFAPIFGLIDALAYGLLENDSHMWGKQRLWGTVGLALFGPASGILMDLTSDENGGINYNTAFLLFGIFQFTSALCVSHYSEAKPTAHKIRVLAEFKSLLRIPRVIVLFAVVAVFAMYSALIETFLYWHLQTLGSPPQGLLGLAVLFNAIPETLVFFMSGIFIRKLGHVQCLYVVCVAYAVRFFSYSFISEPWTVLLVEPVHGLTFGLMYSAASTYASYVSPAGLHGTVQGFLSALYFGVGRGCGCILAGQFYELFGAVTTFRYYGASSLVLLAIFFVTQTVLDRTHAERKDKHTYTGTKITVSVIEGVDFKNRIA